MSKINVMIQNQERKIYGMKYSPEERKPGPIVIVSHGYNGSYVNADHFCQYLCRHGISTYCYDFCGGSVNSKSSGKTTDMTIFTEVGDLKAVIEEVKTWEDVDPDQIYLFGESQGGFVTALTAEEYQDQIRGVLLHYPALCIPDDWDRQFPDLDKIPEEYEFWGMTLGRKFFETIHGFSVFDHIGTYNRNVLIFHGSEDPVVSVEYSRKACALYPHAQLEVFPGEGHGFSAAGCDRVDELTYEFIQKNK